MLVYVTNTSSVELVFLLSFSPGPRRDVYAFALPWLVLIILLNYYVRMEMWIQHAAMHLSL